jgi:hypothetical protein
MEPLGRHCVVILHHPELRRGLVEEIDQSHMTHTSSVQQRLPSRSAERLASLHATTVARDHSHRNSRSCLWRRFANRNFAVSTAYCISPRYCTA